MLQPVAPPLLILVLLLAALAAYFDLRTRRIPNWLSLTGCAAGLSLNTAFSGTNGLRSAALGLGLGFVLYFPLWLLGARGAGDVKLLAAAGSFLGVADTLALFLLAAVLGGILALGLVLIKGATRQTLWNIADILRTLLLFKRPAHRLSSPGAVRLPHGLVIFLAILVEVVILGRVRNG